MSYWRRTRIISFRVSDREFELLKAKSEAEGARSVSDFARLAVCGSGTATAGTSTESIDVLKDQLDELNTYVRRVAEMLEQKQPSVSRSALTAVGRKTGRM